MRIHLANHLTGIVEHAKVQMKNASGHYWTEQCRTDRETENVSTEVFKEDPDQESG